MTTLSQNPNPTLIQNLQKKNVVAVASKALRYEQRLVAWSSVRNEDVAGEGSMTTHLGTESAQPKDPTGDLVRALLPVYVLQIVVNSQLQKVHRSCDQICFS